MLALLLLLASGCSINRAMAPDSYTVQRGDTLSDIGLEYGIDWRQLAQWNHVAPPYQLNVGQRLWLTPYPPIDYANLPAGNGNTQAPMPYPPGRIAGNSTPPLRRTIAPRPSQQYGQQPSAPSYRPPIARQPDEPVRQPRTATVTAGPTSPRTAPVAQGAENSGDDARISQTSRSSATAQTQIKAGGPSEDGWQWPATGSLIRQYDPDDGRQGVEIGGKVGAPVYAASSGTVVYNGSGLKGYGKLIIIKHDEHYLSAYGFNQSSLVSQGQTVAAGAHIADMGLGPENKPMLHFEVRRDGDPINPAKVLPRQ